MFSRPDLPWLTAAVLVLVLVQSMQDERQQVNAIFFMRCMKYMMWDIKCDECCAKRNKIPAGFVGLCKCMDREVGS